MNNKKMKNNNFIDALKNAIKGIIYTIKTQSNIRKQLVIAVLVVLFGLYYKLSNTQIICLVFAITMVLFGEMINTAIETVVDMYTSEYNEKAGIAKDVAAGGVLVLSIGAIFFAYFIFWNNIIDVINRIVLLYMNNIMYIVITICIAAILWLILFKVNKKKESSMKVGERIFHLFMLILITILAIGLFG